MTNDQNAPERIWIVTYGNWTADESVYWDYNPGVGESPKQEYIRADIHEAVVKELSTIRAQLRIECQVENCNDWPDDLHLADVIEKHLCRNLRQTRKGRENMKTQVQLSIDAEFKTVHNMTVMGEVQPSGIHFVIEGGDTHYTEKQAEELARGILSTIKKSRRLYRRIYGRKVP